MKKRNSMLARRTVYCGVAETARRVGCSREHLSRVLHGHRPPNPKLRRHLKSLGVKLP